MIRCRRWQSFTIRFFQQVDPAIAVQPLDLLHRRPDDRLKQLAGTHAAVQGVADQLAGLAALSREEVLQVLGKRLGNLHTAALYLFVPAFADVPAGPAGMSGPEKLPAPPERLGLEGPNGQQARGRRPASLVKLGKMRHAGKIGWPQEES